MNQMINFNVKAFLIAAEELVRADEVERALNLLDNLPAYYRDYEPREVTKLRNEIMERIATPSFYRDCDKDFELPDYDPTRATLRYVMIQHEVGELNKRNLVPHIHDYAPGSFFVPVLLQQDGLKFTYSFTDLGDTAARHVHPIIKDKLAKHTEGQPKIFLAYEIIEHLWHQPELKTEMLKAIGLADVVHVSTPKYSFDYNCLNWRSRDTLGHLRAYTPKEFFETVQKIFGEYVCGFYDSQILHTRCVLKNSKFDYQLDVNGET